MKKRFHTSNPLFQVFRDAFRICLDLFKILIPVIVLVKILQEMDLIQYLAYPLGPVMNWVGLPKEMGLVWATAILNSVYSAIVVLLALAKDSPLTTAQATIISTMILIAHSLPVELKIAQKSGARTLFQAVSRLGSALLLGWLLNTVYTHMNQLQQPVTILFKSSHETTPGKESLLSWAAGEAQNLLFIFLVVFGLLLLMHLLEKIRLIDLMNKILRPVLKFMGIGPKASTIAIVGIILGIVFGGGLILHEAKSGRIPKQDVFFAFTLMGLSHSLIEDTLLMMMLGADLSGILWARMAFTVVLVALIVKASRLLPGPFCDRYFWGTPK